jgi:hypothetical protein
MARRIEARPKPERIGGQTAIPAGKAVLAWFEAPIPGEAAIVTTEKQYLTDTPRDMERLKVVVYPVPRPLKAREANGHRLEQYHARKLFMCAIPGDWLKVSNERGIIAYQAGRRARTGPMVSVHFYGCDGRTTYGTADEYVNRLMRERPSRQERPPDQQVLRRLFDAFRKERPAKPQAPARLREIAVAGRRARTVERTSSATAKQLVVFTKRFPVEEKFVVVPAETGFYVLCFSTPAGRMQQSRDLFEAVMTSFQPLR